MNTLLVVDMIETFADDGELPVQGTREMAVRLHEWLADRMRWERYDHFLASKCWHPANWRELPEFHHFSDTPNNGADPDLEATWNVHGVAGTPMTDFITELGYGQDGVVFDAVFLKGQTGHDYSVFEGKTVFGATLENWAGSTWVPFENTITLVGTAFDVCVTATALEGVQKGYRMRVLKEFTTSVFPERDADTIRCLEDAGVMVLV